VNTALIFYLILFGGLTTMLLDGWGWVAWGVYLFVMPVGALAVRRATLHSWPAVLRPVTRQTLGRAALATVLAAALVLVLFALLSLTGQVEAEKHGVSLRTLLTGVLGPQLLVASWEELTFRGALQPVAIRHLGQKAGLMVASALFGLFHLPNILYHEVPAALIPQTVTALILMGAIFGLATLRDGGYLAVPIALHYGWNSACFGLEEAFSYRFVGPQWLIGTSAWFPESGLLGAATLMVLAGIARWLTGPRVRSAQAGV
jgi:membrane protease YdiL (CAAX protease family)